MATLPVSRAPQARRGLAGAAAIALAVELMLLGGVLVVLTHERPTPRAVEAPPTMLTLAAPAAQPAPAPAPAAPRPQPAPVRHSMTPAHPVVHAAPPQPRPLPKPQPVEHPPVTPTAVPTDPPAEPMHPPAPPAEAHPSAPPAHAPAAGGPTPSFEGAMRAAIQAALRYPESARMAGMSGRTRVAFQYRDGAVSNLSVVISSGIGVLDRAALAAVRDADYPKPEPGFVGKTLSEQLWVTFDLDDSETGS
jgi:periplasmic protein TonB